jgi:hypothetical protein
MSTILAYDPGYGNIKLYGAAGGLLLPSAVAAGDGRAIGRMTGLRAARRPLRIETAAGVFHVGRHAHDWGRPVENMDFQRLTGTPELMALWYGALTRYGLPDGPLELYIGLPIDVLMGEDAPTIQAAVREALRGHHGWRADGVECLVEVASVRITSQPVGAMFDYLLDDQGRMLPARQRAFRGEIGILGIGMNTLDLLVVRGGSPVQRFTAGETLGVRRLLEMTSPDGLRSLAERDAALRSGALSVEGLRALWQSEVLGFIERHWGREFRRFNVIVAAGGGSLLLREGLLRHFRERLYLPDDPLISTARGLYRYARMRAGRTTHG